MPTGSIKQRVDDAVKDAMRAQQKQRLGTIRLITAAFKQREVDERIEITDQIALQVLEKMVKQRRDSIQQFQAAKRDDLVAQEQFELDTIKEFMPAQLSTEEVTKIVADAITQSGAKTAKDMGAVMAILKPQLQGRADMGEASKIIKSRLSAE